MTGCNSFCSHTDGMFEESFELDFRITQYIRVGRASGFVFAQKITEHTVFIFFGKIDRFNRNIHCVGN